MGNNTRHCCVFCVGMDRQDKAEAVVDAMTTGSFFHFRQNNSYGRFDIDLTRGISSDVLIQADDIAEAFERAETMGLYFDGAGDCPCCGDRWERDCFRFDNLDYALDKLA